MHRLNYPLQEVQIILFAEDTMIRFKLTQPQAARLRSLLRMEYTILELAEELDASKRHIRQACESGCPHRVDERQRTWIVGTDFAAWYTTLVAERKHPLAPDEAFCLSCRKPVKLIDSQTITQRDGIVREVGTCPNCGKIVNRFREKTR